jgi:hypothetical protein
MSEVGSAFSFTELEARLEDPDKQLLVGVAFDDKEAEATNPLAQALACVQRLANEDREARRAELKARVVAAQRAGNVEEARGATEELMRLDRQ